MKKAFLVISAVFLFSYLCYAQQGTPQSLKEQAYGKINVASELMNRAKGLLVSTPSTKEKLVTASQLYIQAGQLFEESGNILRSIGKEYSSQEDIENCARATQTCLEALNNIKRILGVKDIPTPPASSSPKTLQ